MEIKYQTTITCPNCGFKKEETMPDNACLFKYVCTNCKTELKSKSGHQCIYCSFGDVDCPPKQKGDDCC